jgi:hypothetical protein
MLSGTPIGKLGIANIYAPNSLQERGELLDSLSEVLDNSHSWVLGGDWNMIKNHEDKSNNCSRILLQ